MSAWKGRKLVSLLIRQSLKTGKSAPYAPKRAKNAADLTKEILDSGGLADDTIHAVQFLDGRRKGRWWLVAPVAHSPSRAPQDSYGDGLPGDAHQQLGRVVLLEL